VSALDKMICETVKCTICGAGYGKCGCWTKCGCGWSYLAGAACNNPKHGIGDGTLTIVAAADLQNSKLFR
jgi:hypothetical protein